MKKNQNYFRWITWKWKEWTASNGAVRCIFSLLLLLLYFWWFFALCIFSNPERKKDRGGGKKGDGRKEHKTTNQSVFSNEWNSNLGLTEAVLLSFFFVRVLISLRWSVWFVDKMDHLNRFSKRKICDNFEIELRCRLSNKSLILGWRPFIILSVSFIHFEISFSRALCFIFSINFETALLEFFLENGHNFRLKTMRNYCFKLGLGLRERFTIKKPSIALWERTRNRTIYIYIIWWKKKEFPFRLRFNMQCRGPPERHFSSRCHLDKNLDRNAI